MDFQKRGKPEFSNAMVRKVLTQSESIGEDSPERFHCPAHTMPALARKPLVPEGLWSGPVDPALEVPKMVYWW